MILNEVKDIIAGLEINRDCSRLSCFDREKGRPECIYLRPGTENAAFPTVLKKTDGGGRWYIPKEPDEDAEGISVNDLYDVFCASGPVEYAGKIYEPWKLMAVFIKNALEFTGIRDILDNVKAIMITSYEIERDFAENALKAMASLQFSPGSYFVQDHMESFFYYCISRNIDLYKKRAGVFNYSERDITFESLILSRSTTPNTARIREYPGIDIFKYDEELDKKFLEYAKKSIADDEYSLIYINGPESELKRIPGTGQYLSSDFRRVFAGDDLYVKGACIGAYERTESKSRRNILYIGKNMLHTNVGMGLLSGEREIYYPIITAGVNWFEADKTFTVMPHDTNKLIFKVTSLDGKHEKDVPLILSGLEKRPVGTTKIEIHAGCENAGKYIITAKDLGFGDMYPSKGKTYELVLEINDDFWKSEGDERPDNRIYCRLCKVSPAQTPYHIDSVNLNLYSIEEFCYFVFRYPELIDEEVINLNVRDWFRDDLKLTDLAREITAVLREDSEIMAFFEPVFRSAGYLTKKEQKAFQKRIEQFEEMPPMVRLKKKGDALAGYKKYTMALKAYSQAEKLTGDVQENGAYLASLYNNMGTVYMRLLRYAEAEECFYKAYMNFHTRGALKTYLLAAAISRPRSRYEELLAKMHVDDELKKEIDDSIKTEISRDIPEDNRSRKVILDSLISEYHNN